MISFLDNNHTFALRIPITYIIMYILFFTKNYCEKRVVKIVSSIIGVTILAVICLLYILNFSETYIMSWISKPIVPFILMLYLPVEKKSITSIDKKDKVRFFKNIIIGMVIMFIPGSKWYSALISNLEYNEYIISEMLVFFCGVITIYLNKYAVNKILKIKKWNIKLMN
ncbi:MAG: hypothetical protein GX258_11430 [Clostridiales bacterium]|nr:hypothetical protein [Clostridiales bacterium]